MTNYYMAAQPAQTSDLVNLLMERASHVEDLLIGTLLGFFAMATIGGFGAAYKLRAGKPSALSLTPRQFFMGMALLYALLSGYYYFMLGQFYGAVVALLSVSTDIPGLPLATLWEILRFPSFWILSPSVANLAFLLGAPLFPLALSTAFLWGLWLFIRDPDLKNPKETLVVKDLVAGLLIQLAFFVMSGWLPFLRFLSEARIMNQ